MSVIRHSFKFSQSMLVLISLLTILVIGFSVSSVSAQQSVWYFEATSIDSVSNAWGTFSGNQYGSVYTNQATEAQLADHISSSYDGSYWVFYSSGDFEFYVAGTNNAAVIGTWSENSDGSVSFEGDSYRSNTTSEVSQAVQGRLYGDSRNIYISFARDTVQTSAAVNMNGSMGGTTEVYVEATLRLVQRSSHPSYDEPDASSMIVPGTNMTQDEYFNYICTLPDGTRVC